MKKYLVIVLSVSLLVSCSKKDVTAPETHNSFYYQDNGVGQLSMDATQTAASTITVNFRTSYQKQVQKIELMSSGDTNHFCSIDVISVNGDSNTPTSYSFNDTQLKGDPMYYMLRITYTNGDWSFTPVYTVNVNQ